MMYLNKNSVNPVVLELTAVSSLLNPFYLFEMINDINPLNKTYFTGTDLSPYKCRFNRFEVILTSTTANYTASTFNLLSGSYTYNVYEATAMTLSVSGTTGRIISKGNKAIVNGIDTEIPNIYR